MASEIDDNCINVYNKNFPKTPIIKDIRDNWEKLPKFDMLCGGFPCQPFSKAGKQDGFNDKSRGDLFSVIIKILNNHPECKFIILENVRNLSDKTENWDIIQKSLGKLNFYVTEKPLILSPNQFGVPQMRERVYILGIRKDIRDIKKLTNGFIHLEELGLQEIQSVYNSKFTIKDIEKVLEKQIDDKYYLSWEKKQILDIWEEFRKGTNFAHSSCPIWLDYMGINLNDNEYENTYFYQRNENVKKRIVELPEWKRKIVLKNRQFYLSNKRFIDEWVDKYNMLDKISTYKKFEWYCGEKYKSLKEVIIQFRHSGIRTKKPIFFPTLVAINNTPIIWDNFIEKYRYITPREAANLQSFDKNFIFSNIDSVTYRQLGNAVNVKIIKFLAKKLLNFALEDWKEK
ncbi:hypothetical protein MSATCC14277_4680 [Metamycoplasma salivarium]|nr:hypothetical protein MSATCC14277_4680 [Metamycoplasma salivarium]